VPGLQAGYAKGRTACEQILVMRLAQEQCVAEGGTLCIGFCDWNCFFQSCVRQCQWKCEEWTGVDPGVTAVIQALHEEAQGQYETAASATPVECVAGSRRVSG